MTKMEGIVALSVALTISSGAAAFMAQAAPKDQKEAKRSKADQIDFDTLTMIVDNTETGRPAGAADISVTWESNHFFRAPDGSTYVPFTVTVDSTKLAAPTPAISLAVFPKGAAAAPAPPAKGKDHKSAAPTPVFDK